MKILVGFDGSNSGKEALTIAKKHATFFNADVSVVMSMVKGTENEQEEIDQANKDLEYAKEFFENDNIQCEIHLLIRGLSAGEDLVEFANENNIDEIVVGVKRRSKVGKLLMGSTAQYVILKAKCPVVSVK